MSRTPGGGGESCIIVTCHDAPAHDFSIFPLCSKLRVIHPQRDCTISISQFWYKLTEVLTENFPGMPGRQHHFHVYHKYCKNNVTELKTGFYNLHQNIIGILLP